TVPANSMADPYNVAGYGLDVPSATIVGGQQTVFLPHSSGQSALRVTVPAGKTGGWILGDNQNPVTMDINSRVCGATVVWVRNWQGELAFGALLVPIAAFLLGRRRIARRRALRNHPHAA